MTGRSVLLSLLAATVAGAMGAGVYLLATSSPGHVAAPLPTAATTSTGAIGSTATTASPTPGCARPSFSTSSHHGGITYGAYYVSNNMWNPLSVKQTLYACSYHSWYVESNMTSQGGAVQTYPNSQMTFTQRPKLSTLTSLSSSFSESTTPSGSRYDYEYAYDIWINGYGGPRTSELMIWNYDDGQTPAGTPSGTFADGGHTYHVYVSGNASTGDYIAFVAASNFTSGTLNLVDFFHYATSKQWIDQGSSAKLWQVDYGVEICATGGHLAKFEFSNFQVSPVYVHPLHGE